MHFGGVARNSMGKFYLKLALKPQIIFVTSNGMQS